MLTKAIVVLLVCSSAGRMGDIPIRVDMIEYNTFVDDKGEERYTQLIAWEWMPDYSRYVVSAWIMDEQVTLKPTKRGDYWHAEMKGVRIKSRVFLRSHTTYDPESMDKKMTNDTLRPSTLTSRIRRSPYMAH